MIDKFYLKNILMLKISAIKLITKLKKIQLLFFYQSPMGLKWEPRKQVLLFFEESQVEKQA